MYGCTSCVQAKVSSGGGPQNAKVTAQLGPKQGEKRGRLSSTARPASLLQPAAACPDVDVRVPVHALTPQGLSQLPVQHLLVCCLDTRTRRVARTGTHRHAPHDPPPHAEPEDRKVEGAQQQLAGAYEQPGCQAVAEQRLQQRKWAQLVSVRRLPCSLCL